jgi:hypothetical protein
MYNFRERLAGYELCKKVRRIWWVCNVRSTKDERIAYFDVHRHFIHRTLLLLTLMCMNLSTKVYKNYSLLYHIKSVPEHTRLFLSSCFSKHCKNGTLFRIFSYSFSKMKFVIFIYFKKVLRSIICK